MSFAAFIGGAMRPTIDRYKAEQETKRRLEEHAAGAKLDKALNEWEFYSPEERAAVAPELDKILKQKKGYSADLLGKSEQGYKFLKGALEQQKPIQELEQSAQRVASKPVNLEGRMTGPESLDAVEPGAFDQSPTLITLPSKPVSLPPLPIEGADIPRVPSDMLQLPASQRAAAIKDYKTRQSEMLARQSKVGEIGTSPLGAEDKETAIEALYLPPGVLSARERAQAIMARGGAPQVGLSAIELVSPDGRQFKIAQLTRTGQLVESGSGRVIDPAEVEGWTKRHFVPPQAFPNQAGSIDVLNKERLQQRMSQDSSLTGTIPDIRPAQTVTPLVDPNTGTIAGQWGSRTGIQGSGQGPSGEGLAKTPRPKGELDARTYLRTAQTQLRTITQLAMKRPDLIGQFDFAKNAGLRAVGMQKDTDANTLYGTLDDLSESLIRAKEGAVISNAMYARLKSMMARGWTNEQQFADDIARMQRVFDTAKEVRGMLTLPDEAGGTTTPSGGGAADTPRIGDVKEFPNGNIGVWDGKGYKKVNRPSQ